MWYLEQLLINYGFFCDKEPKQQWQYIVAISYHYCCIRCIQLFFAKFSLFCTKVWCSNTVLLRFGQSLQLGLSAYKRIMQWINGYRTHPKVIFVLSILHPHYFQATQYIHSMYRCWCFYFHASTFHIIQKTMVQNQKQRRQLTPYLQFSSIYEDHNSFVI